jgi:hypothetical protein
MPKERRDCPLNPAGNDSVDVLNEPGSSATWLAVVLWMGLLRFANEVKPGGPWRRSSEVIPSSGLNTQSHAIF